MRKLVVRILRKLKILPYPAPIPIPRMDLIQFPIGDQLSLLVYWKVLKIGKGPAVVLKACDQEVLKFDCFGEKDGHYHIAPQYDFRIYFFEKTVADQIDRTVAELKVNGLRYLKLHPDPKIRALDPAPDSYLEAIDQAEKQMKHFIQTVKEIQPL